MKIRLLSIGHSMPDWVNRGYTEYARRLCGPVQLELLELDNIPRSKNTNLQTLLAKEYDTLQAARVKGDFLVVLDVQGSMISTEGLATQLENWQAQHRCISLVIGGPDGIDNRLKQQAAWRWSLSPLTFPHPLVRIIVAEQLYRAFSILQHHPYHRQ